MRDLRKTDCFSNGMKKALVLFFAAFIVIPVFTAIAQESGTKFQDARTSYRTGDFGKAAQLFTELAQEFPQTAVFYYDLGNANVKLGRMSEAILAYEKALRLAPRDKDVRTNLGYARGLLEYRVEDNRNWYLKVTDAALAHFTQREINFAALIGTFLFLASGVLYFLFRQGIFWGRGRRTLLALALILAAVAFWKHVQTDMIRDAIVMVKECEARYGPSAGDQVAFRVGEGIKVSIMDRREDWSRVVLTNGDSGWVRNSDIAEVKI